MIELSELLKQHFHSRKCLPRILENFLKSDDSLVIVTFLHSALLVFKKPLLLLQSTSALFPELANIFELKRAILKCHSSEFYGAKTAELLKGIDKDCAEVLKSSFKESLSIPFKFSCFCSIKLRTMTL